LLVEFVDGYMPLQAEEQQEFIEFVHARPEYKDVTKMITSFEKMGIEKGIEKGAVGAKREVLVELLREKFGFVNAVTQNRIEGIESVTRLDALLKAVIHAQSIDELSI